jgi:hypothetical protein
MDSPTSAEGGHVTSEYAIINRCVAREATLMWVGKMKARLRNNLAVPASKV